MHRQRLNDVRGFTVIELLIVCVIIGVLATLVFVAYNGIANNAKIASLTVEMKQANTQLGLSRVDNNGRYPDDLESMNNSQGILFDEEAELLYTAYNDTDPADYCLTAVVGDLVYHVSRHQAPSEGYCEDHEPLEIAETPVIQTTSDSISQITVSWGAVEGAASYTLEYSTNSDFSSGVTTIADLTDLAHAITGLTEDTTYYFRAYSVNDAGQSDASAVVEETTQLNLPEGAPVATCTTNSSSQITVNWSAVDGATSYQVDRSSSSGFTGLTTVTGETGTSYASTGLSAGSRYYFRVYASNDSGLSNASNSVNCITSISAPDSPSVSATIPGSTRAWNSGVWAKTYQGQPTYGTWYYARGAVSSSTCASGTTREQRARIQYNSPKTWGAWTGWTTSSYFYAINPSSGYGIRFQVQTRCKTSLVTSGGSSYGYGCRWSSGSTSCSGF